MLEKTYTTNKNPENYQDVELDLSSFSFDDNNDSKEIDDFVDKLCAFEVDALGKEIDIMNDIITSCKGDISQLMNHSDVKEMLRVNEMLRVDEEVLLSKMSLDQLNIIRPELAFTTAGQELIYYITTFYYFIKLQEKLSEATDAAEKQTLIDNIRQCLHDHKTCTGQETINLNEVLAKYNFIYVSHDRAQPMNNKIFLLLQDLQNSLKSVSDDFAGELVGKYTGGIDTDYIQGLQTRITEVMEKMKM